MQEKFSKKFQFCKYHSFLLSTAVNCSSSMHKIEIRLIGYKDDIADCYIMYIRMVFLCIIQSSQNLILVCVVTLQTCQVSHIRCKTQNTSLWLTLPFTTMNIPYTLMQLCSILTPSLLMGIWLSWQWWSRLVKVNIRHRSVQLSAQSVHLPGPHGSWVLLIGRHPNISFASACPCSCNTVPSKVGSK